MTDQSTLTPAQTDAKIMRDWVGLLTEFDGALECQGRRSRHLRRCRVLACQGMTRAEHADVYRAQKVEFPQMDFWA